MKLIFITSDPSNAVVVDEAGVDRVMVDLEIIGKEARQGHLNTVISRHQIEDVSAVRKALKTAELLVRVNPIHPKLKDEIDAVIAAGAQRLMLPMFRHPDEVVEFLDLVDGRVPTVLLLETSAAFARLPQILKVRGVDEIHIGLNDLHLDMQLDFMFEPFSGGLIDHAARLMRDAHIPFGIGGVARLGAGLLPAEMILSEHVRVGSQAVILSRDFGQALQTVGAFASEVQRLRAHLRILQGTSGALLEQTRSDAAHAIQCIAADRRLQRATGQAANRTSKTP